jgi:hypothetical protein
MAMRDIAFCGCKAMASLVEATGEPEENLYPGIALGGASRCLLRSKMLWLMFSVPGYCCHCNLNKAAAYSHVGKFLFVLYSIDLFASAG